MPQGFFHDPRDYLGAAFVPCLFGRGFCVWNVVEGLMGLRLAFKAKTACMPWRLRSSAAIDCRYCAECDMEIEFHAEQRGYELLCIYCAMEQGVLPEDEIEPGDNRTLHEMAMGKRKDTAYDEWEPN